MSLTEHEEDDVDSGHLRVPIRLWQGRPAMYNVPSVYLFS